MEEHKARALQRFLGGSVGINECCKALESKVDELIGSYQSLSSNQSLGDERTKEDSKRKFLMLMVKDGVFLYEFMRGYPDGVGLGNGRVGWEYDDKDPVFSVRALRNIPNIVADILMLENQLPITVLERLIAVEKRQLNELHHKEVNELVLKFLLPELPSLEEVNELVLKFFSAEPPSATIAFECLHPATNNEVSSYIAFLQGLIPAQSDVAFLRSKNFIQSEIGDDQAVYGLMITISKNVLFDPSSKLCVLRDDLNQYYKYNMRKRRRRPREWCRALRQGYCKNPWTITGVITAAVLLILTALQTIYTMMDKQV